MISLLPGPVEIAPDVREAFALPPISHRTSEFVSSFEAVRESLRRRANAGTVALLVGTGTLANDAVAAQLEGPGLVISNGEFGERLIRHAQCSGRDFRSIKWPWGRHWDLNRVELEIGEARWIWAVHHETSTGMLNDVDGLLEIASRRDVRVCLDCVSSLGAVDLDLSRVWLASGVSGKAIGSYAGVAIVFAARGALRERRIPAYLDAFAAATAEGPLFTFPSPSIMALQAALRADRDYRPLACLVRQRMRRFGWQPLIDDSMAAPVITTFAEPEPGFVGRCRDLGFAISGDSGYLRERGWVQIATMGNVGEYHIETLFDGLACSKSSYAHC